MKRIYRTDVKPQEWIPHEYMIDDSSDADNLPTGDNIPAASTAYTADLSLMLQYNGAEWVQIGGS